MVLDFIAITGLIVGMALFVTGQIRSRKRYGIEIFLAGTILIVVCGFYLAFRFIVW